MVDRVKHVGIRQFREELAEYLASPVPLAIRKYGRTIGYYVPTQGSPRDEDIEGLGRAAQRIQNLMAEYGVTEDQVVEEFKARRRADR